MTWNLVRLTLARTPEFPGGSDEHAYELVLPLIADGRIDAKAFAATPTRATVQRIVPRKGVQSSHILHRQSACAFSYVHGDADDEAVFHLENHPLIEGNYLTLTEPDGDQLPFRVIAVQPLPSLITR